VDSARLNRVERRGPLIPPRTVCDMFVNPVADVNYKRPRLSSKHHGS
jgi:hypothetical protein